MAQLAPFNLDLIDPDEYIKRKDCYPVTVHAMYESSTQRFHPDGLFSEVIFGQVGSSQRLIRRGYIDLHTKVMSPHLYKQIISLKSYYADILAGKQYAYFDNELKDLVRTTVNDPNGDTGYAFFVECLPKIKFALTDSYQRTDKIKLIEKYKNKLFITKYIVLPAGVRDVKIKNGRPESEAINKLYLGLLSLSQALPVQGSEDPIYNAYRYQIQCKLVEIYDYIKNLLEGKGGFIQSKYARRNVVYGTRNVITAGITSNAASSDAPNQFSIDEVQLPLFQVMKEVSPAVVYWMRRLFFNTIFVTGEQSPQLPLIHPRTFELEYHEVDPEDLRKFSTAEGVEDIINDFRDPTNHFRPVGVKLRTPVKYQNETLTEFYLYLIYDTGDTVRLYRDWHVVRKQPSLYTDWFRDHHPKVDVLRAYDPSTYVITGTCALYAYGMNIEPEDVDVIFNPKLWEQFKTYAQSLGAKPDERGDYEVTLDGIEIHTKNGTEKVYTEETWNNYVKEHTIEVHGYRYTSVQSLHQRYHEIAALRTRLKDTRKLEFLDRVIVDETKIRPLTYVEMCYMATFYGTKGKHFTATRYPVLNLYNLNVYKAHVTSTDPGRIVKHLLGTADSTLYPEYPRMDHKVKQSMSIHPATLGHYGADHDGDALSSMAILSDEANEEIKKYLESDTSLLTSDGSLVYGLTGGGAGVVIGFSLFYASYHQLSDKRKK